jgi:uncharacterized membrane protein
VSVEEFEVLVARVLRTGVTVSGVLIAIGFASSLVLGWNGSLVGAPPGPLDPTDFTRMWSGLADVRPLAITQLGLLALIATPVVRVAVSVVAFQRQHDRTYAVISLVVLGLLLASLFLIR